MKTNKVFTIEHALDPCYLCGELKPGRMTADHIEPIASGGSNVRAENYAMACYDCNHAKSGQSLLVFLARRAYYGTDNEKTARLMDRTEARRPRAATLLRKFRKELGRT